MTDSGGSQVWQGGFEPLRDGLQLVTLRRYAFRASGRIPHGTMPACTTTSTRWYGDGTGRYTQPDPIGLRGDTNLYIYAIDEPLINIDLDGRQYYPGLPSPWADIPACAYSIATQFRALGSTNGLALGTLHGQL